VDRAAKFFKGDGCKKCLGSGFSGRIPIFEIMPITSDITVAIEAGVPHSKLHELAVAAGMIELPRAGLEQALAGRTSIEEVYFKTSGDRRSADAKKTAASLGRRDTDVA
jgi:type IV pilus assembly protein PilB